MTKEEIALTLNRIVHDYHVLPEPKYRNASLDILKRDYELFAEIKYSQQGNLFYDNIVNAIAQTINKMTPKNNDWRSVSERGINKAIPPVIKKKNHPIEFPFQWIDEKSGKTC